MSKLLELELKKARLLITYDMLGIKARAGARAGVKDEVKAEVSRIEAEIAKLKEQGNE